MAGFSLPFFVFFNLIESPRDDPHDLAYN